METVYACYCVAYVQLKVCMQWYIYVYVLNIFIYTLVHVYILKVSKYKQNYLENKNLKILLYKACKVCQK